MLVTSLCANARSGDEPVRQMRSDKKKRGREKSEQPEQLQYLLQNSANSADLYLINNEAKTLVRS